jgi:hypothetical protein
MKNASLMFSIFAANAAICIEKGLSVQDCANINKIAAIEMFGLSELQAENSVAAWVKACQKSKLLA